MNLTTDTAVHALAPEVANFGAQLPLVVVFVALSTAALWFLSTSTGDDFHRIPGPPAASNLFGHLPQVGECGDDARARWHAIAGSAAAAAAASCLCCLKVHPHSATFAKQCSAALALLQLNVLNVHHFWQECCRKYGQLGMFKARPALRQQLLPGLSCFLVSVDRPATPRVGVAGLAKLTGSIEAACSVVLAACS
jgi:hypothetical protein